MTALEALHVLVCLALAWTCACRIAKTNDRTRAPVRLAFVYGTSTSLLLAAAPWLDLVWPWFPPFRPHEAVLAVLVAVIAFQVATARYWRSGPPRHFQRSS